MRSPLALLLLVFSLSASSVFADFSQFFFAGDEGNSSAVRHCPQPDTEWPCSPPDVCAYDDRTLKYYCCRVGSTDAVCWTASPACDGDSSDSTVPSGGQQSCASADTKYCCAKERYVNAVAPGHPTLIMYELVLTLGSERCTEQSGMLPQPDSSWTQHSPLKASSTYVGAT